MGIYDRGGTVHQWRWSINGPGAIGYPYGRKQKEIGFPSCAVDKKQFHFD